jgi:hypothetical protein
MIRKARWMNPEHSAILLNGDTTVHLAKKSELRNRIEEAIANGLQVEEYRDEGRAHRRQEAKVRLQKNIRGYHCILMDIIECLETRTVSVPEPALQRLRKDRESIQFMLDELSKL